MQNVSNKFLGKVLDTEELQPVEPDIKPSEAYKYDIGVGDVLGRSFKNDSLVTIGANKIMDEINDNKYEIDDKFDSKIALDSYVDINIHDDFKDSLLSRAKNQEHFDSMIGYYEEQSAVQRELERYGFGSQLLLGLAPEITNAPIYIGAAAMLPQTAAMMGSAALLRFATSGSAGIAIEGLKDVLGEQDKHALDYAGAAIFDGALGAAFGKRTNTFTNIANDMVLRSHGMTKDVVAMAKKATSKEERNMIIGNAYKIHSGKQADNTLLDVLDSNVEYASQNIVQKAWGSVRQDLAYTTGNSESKTFSDFSKRMFPDATLQNLDLNNPDMATGRDLLEETMRAKRQTIFSPLIKQYTNLAHNSGGVMGIKPSGQMEREFGDLLGEIQLARSIDDMDIDQAVKYVMNKKKLAPSDDMTKLLTDGAKGMEELSLDYHKTLGENGHEDFSSGLIKEDGTYMPYIYNKESFAPLLNKGVKEGMIADFFKNAIKNTLGDDISDEALNTIAMAFYQAVSTNNVKRLNTFDSVMDEILTGKGYTDEVKELVGKIQETKFDSSGDASSKFANKRTNIDYSHKQEFQLDDGTKIEISFKDFLGKDYLNNMDTYVRKMSGTTVLRKHGWTEDPEPNFNIKRDAENSPEILALRKKIDEIKAKAENQEGLELFKTLGNNIIRSLDNETGLALSKALSKEDYQTAMDIVFEQMQKAGNKIDEADSNRLFQLADEFITGPRSDLDKFEIKYAEMLAREIEELKLSSKTPVEFRMKSKADYNAFRDKVRSELMEAVESGKITTKQADKDLVRLDTILKDMSGIATAKDPMGNLNRFYRIAHSYNVGRLLGQTFFTMPAEAMNVMWDQGLGSFIESMPAMKSLIRAYKNGNIDNAQAREINEAMGMYDEFLSGPRLYEFDHDFDATTNYTGKAGKAVDKIERWGENFAEFTLMSGGIKPLTAWFQTAHVMGVFKKMRMVAEGGPRNSNYQKMVGELGFSEEMEGRVYQNMLNHFSDGKMNFNDWDGDVKNVFLMGVKRRTDTLVQMQRLGDKPAWVSEQDYMFKDTFVGKVTMELKQFVMTAYVKQLGRALNRKDQYMIGLIASQMAALTLSYMGKQTLNYAGNEEKFKRAMSTENIVAGTMGMMPQGSVLPMVMNFGSNLVFGQNILGTSRHNSQATDMMSSLAIVDGVNRVMQAMSIPFKTAKGDFDNKTLKPVAGLTGVSNHWLTKAFYESTQNK